MEKKPFQLSNSQLGFPFIKVLRCFCFPDAHSQNCFFQSKSGPSLHSGGMQNDQKTGGGKIWKSKPQRSAEEFNAEFIDDYL